MPDSSIRPQANRGAPFETLLDPDDAAPEGPAPADHRPKASARTDRPPDATRGGLLPPDLRRYGERLAIGLQPDRPTVIVNFVSSLDGVVTVDPEHGSGGQISGFNEPDRFVMGLLRSLADVIVVGAGTLRAASSHTWTPRRVNPAFGDAYEAWRAALGLAKAPTTIIVTASGDLPIGHPALQSRDVPAIVVATPEAAVRLRATLPARVRVETAPDDDHVSAQSILDVARRNGARLILSEAGPHLTGTFVKARLLDELFLTMAPQLLGRAGEDRGVGPGPGDVPDRYSFVEGVAFEPEDAPWARLQSVRRSREHLFLRYAFGPAFGG
jgi:riboflavin biosynthesis pyrimidine reductase